ncbi:MAG: hypothetical protein OEU54_07915 [Gemmatimonadota bacterium]|nr:hypothetical protein [Gemmatimonadota bacterium]
MKIRNGITKLTAAAAVVFLAGCQNSEVAGPGQSSGTVSANEAAAISTFLVSSAFEGWGFDDVGGGGGGASLRSSSGVPITIDYAVDVTSGCPLGGDLGVSGSITGSIDDQTLAGDLSLSVVTSAANCAFLHEQTEFTLNTNPDLVLAGGFAFDQGELVGEATFTYTGTVLWAADDGRSGSCVYAVAVAMDAAGSVVESGTVCGQSL